MRVFGLLQKEENFMESNDIIEEVVEIPANEPEEKVGNIKISVDVVAAIAGIATNEVEGVAGMNSSLAGGIAEIFGTKKNVSRGVKVDIKEENTVIDLFITVDYGVRIPELAWEIQENVKNSVETMTGLTVEKVNIHVEGVSFEKEKAAAEAMNTENEPTNESEEPEDIIIEEASIEEEPEPGSEDL